MMSTLARSRVAPLALVATALLAALAALGLARGAHPAVLVGVAVAGTAVVCGVAGAIASGLSRATSEGQAAAHAERAENERNVATLRAEVDRLAGQASELRRVLDATQQGFVTIDVAGRMSAERSRVFREWLGEPVNDRIQDYVGFVDPIAGEWLEIGLQAIGEGTLPRELLLEQLPRRIQTGNRVLEVRYVPIEEDDRLGHLLLVLTDVTGHIERERIEREQQEVVAILQRVGANPWSFTDFFDETKQMVALLETHPPPAVALRILHTLKGNATTFGITSMEAVCHQAEEEAALEGLGPAQIERVVHAWGAVQARVRTLLPQKRSATISVSEVEYRALLQRVRDVAPAQDLIAALDAWQLEPVEDRLQTLADHARRVAERLGRGPLKVEVDGHHLRLEPGRWSSFWAALVHVVRNAVDHGLEPPGERGSKGTPTLRLTAEIADDRLIVRVSDDGRGIDWDKVAVRARAMELPAESRQDLEAALFVDGFSTHDRVSVVSGRGIGLPAVLGEVQVRGGSITLSSEPGAGTCVEISIPTAFRWVAAAA